MKKNAIFCSLFSIMTMAVNCCFAQYKLSGQVTNIKKQPVSKATILLGTPKNRTSVIQQTGRKGSFVFNDLKEGNYFLSIYALHHSTKKIQISIHKDTILHVTLRPLSKELQGLTISGTKPVIQRKAGRIIFNVTNSISAAGSDGLAVLSEAPGVQVSGDKIALAGQGALGVMVNGRLLHLSDKALIGYLRSFSSAGIDKIEIIPHPSAQYDAEGVAGLINIVTKKNRQEGWSGNITGSLKRFFYKDQPNYKGIKNYGDAKGTVGLYYNNANWSFYTQAGYNAGRELWGYGIDVFYEDKHWAMKDTGEYRIPTFNVLAGTDYTISPNTTIGFSYNYMYHLEEGADYVNIPVYNNQGNQDSLIHTYATYHPIAKGNAFNLHLIQKLSESGAKLNLNADYFNYYRTDRSDLTTKTILNNGQISNAGTSQLYDTTLQNIRIYTFKADVNLPSDFAHWNFGSKLSFINNYSSIYYYHIQDKNRTYDKDLSNEFRYIENTQALYANGSKTIKKWQISAGLRAEITQTKALSYFNKQEVKKRYLKLFPSVSITFKPNEKNNLSFNYNKRIHRPTFWNMNPYKTFMSAYTYVEGNPYLEPEYVSHFALAHRYKHLLTSSLFIRMINNGFARVIQTHDQGDYHHTTTNLNFFSSHRYGWSESVSFHPFQWFENTSLAKAYYTKVNSRLSYINGIDGFGGYVETRNHFYLNNEKTLDASLVFWYQFPEIDHFGRSDAYYSVDAGIQWITLQKKLHLALNFNDIFQSSAFGVTTTVNGVKNKYTYFQLNSQLRLSAAWYFGKKEKQNINTESSNQAERNRL